MSGKLLIAGIDGSCDKTSPKVVRILEEALAAAKDAVSEISTETALIRLKDYNYPHHSGDLEAPVPQVLRPVVDVMLRAHGIMFISPVHYWQMSDKLHSFICHLTPHEYPLFSFRGKVVAALSHCHDDGGQTVAQAIIGTLGHFGFKTPPDYIFYRNSRLQKSEGDWQQTEHLRLGRSVALEAYETFFVRK